VYGIVYSIQCTVRYTLFSVHYTLCSTLYRIQYIIQYTVQCKIYSLQCIIQCTVYSVQYFRAETAFLAVAARMHASKPRIFRLFYVIFGYKPFIFYTSCVLAMYVQYGCFIHCLPFILVLSPAAHNRKLKYDNWVPVKTYFIMI
jgi:hypothetical protein